MSLFPTYAVEPAETVLKESTAIPVEYEINWEEKKLTGKIVSGLDAIKIWIKLALKTPRYRYIIYTWDYGTELEELIGQNHSIEYLESETKRMIEECLQIHEQVGQIRDFFVTLERDWIDISFVVDTPYGSIQIQERH